MELMTPRIGGQNPQHRETWPPAKILPKAPPKAGLFGTSHRLAAFLARCVRCCGLTEYFVIHFGLVESLKWAT